MDENTKYELRKFMNDETQLLLRRVNDRLWFLIASFIVFSVILCVVLYRLGF